MCVCSVCPLNSFNYNTSLKLRQNIHAVLTVLLNSLLLSATHFGSELFSANLIVISCKCVIPACLLISNEIRSAFSWVTILVSKRKLTATGVKQCTKGVNANLNFMEISFASI